MIVRTASLCRAALLALCVALPVTAAQAADDLKTALQGRYDALHAATVARDATAIKAIVTPDFVMRDKQGHSMTGDQMIANMSKVPENVAKSGKTTVLSAEAAGDTASVKQQYEMDVTRQSQDGKDHKISVKAKSDDVWVKQNGIWLIKSTTLTDLQQTLDGKPAPLPTRSTPPKPGAAGAATPAPAAK